MFNREACRKNRKAEERALRYLGAAMWTWSVGEGSALPQAVEGRPYRPLRALRPDIGHYEFSRCRMIFHVTLEKAEDGWMVAQCPALPGCVSQGKDEKEALDNIKEAITAWLWAEDQRPNPQLAAVPKSV